MTQAGGPIAVVGATGHTGGFVAAELERRGLAVRLVGRDPDKLAELAARHPGSIARAARFDKPTSLDAALAGAAAVINCAGPFADTAFPVADAALRARIPYLDVGAEQAVVRALYDTRDAAARSAGIVLLPAMAFYGGLADLLATAAAGDWSEVDEVAIGVALDSWHPTAGTRATGARNTAPRLHVREGRLVPLQDAPPRQHWPFPRPFGHQPVVPLPLSEVITLSRHLPAHTVDSFMNLAPLNDLHDTATPPPQAVDARGRSAQRFMMDVEVRRGSMIRRATAMGQDIYAFTAPLAVEAALRVLARPQGSAGGAFAPGEIFDAADFLDSVARQDGAFSVALGPGTAAAQADRH